MKTIVLKGDARTGTGKKASKAMRNEGKVPCVVYGKSGTQHFGVYEYDFKNLVYTPNTYLVQLNLDGGPVLAKMQDIQFHPVSEAIIHVDFLEIDPNEPLTIDIPVELTGNAPGVRAGGKLMLKIKKLLIKALIKDIPDTFKISVDKLQIGQNIKVGDVNFDGVELLDTKSNSIVSCMVTRASMSASSDEEGGEASGESGGEEGEKTESEAEG
ncbi:MAG: 50S ribosomal protein L25/general stress protein Ctc [Flavobacteriales bacterium]|nr:50S ribosomal protein L25/general stress protein Ctc [Flavobacteriales bacterium]